MLTKPLTGGGTHEVTNHPPPLVDYDSFGRDLELVEATQREGAAWAYAGLLEFGRLAGSQQIIEWGFKANGNPPVLHTHDRFGSRRPGYPKIFNIQANPHEDLNVFGLFPWASEAALKEVERYLASVKKYPNPPAPNVTQFHGAAIP